MKYFTLMVVLFCAFLGVVNGDPLVRRHHAAVAPPPQDLTLPVTGHGVETSVGSPVEDEFDITEPPRTLTVPSRENHRATPLPIEEDELDFEPYLGTVFSFEPRKHPKENYLHPENDDRLYVVNQRSYSERVEDLLKIYALGSVPILSTEEERREGRFCSLINTTHGTAELRALSVRALSLNILDTNDRRAGNNETYLAINQFVPDSWRTRILIRFPLSLPITKDSVVETIMDVVNVLQSTEVAKCERPETFNLGPLRHTAKLISSGNIYIASAKVLVISDFRYNASSGPAVNFWTGKSEDSTPDVNGVVIPDEYGTTTHLKNYSGINVFLVLPGNLTFYDVNYVSVYCRTYGVSFGHVVVPDVIQTLILPPALIDTIPGIEYHFI